MLWMTAETILSLCHIREGFIRKLNINLGFKIMNRDYLGLPRGLSGKESACQAGHVGSISGLGKSLEKEMAMHSSILAWRIPWTEKPGGLKSAGSQRIRHD